MVHIWTEKDFSDGEFPFFETEDGVIFGYGHPTDVSELVPLLNKYIGANPLLDEINGEDIFFEWAFDTADNDDVMFTLCKEEAPGAFPIWSVSN